MTFPNSNLTSVSHSGKVFPGTASGLIATGQGALVGIVINSHTSGTIKFWNNTSAAARANITALNATPTVAGSGYTRNDILTITTGGTLGTAIVTAVDGSGAVVAVVLQNGGSGYTSGTGKATTGGTGTGATLNITSVEASVLFDTITLAVGERWVPFFGGNFNVGCFLTVGGTINYSVIYNN